MLVKNVINRNGNAVPNQFVIILNGAIYFQSSNSIIAKKEKGIITLDADTWDSDTWDYSRTTARYRNQFLGMDTAEIKKRLKSGEIKLENLNT